MTSRTVLTPVSSVTPWNQRLSRLSTDWLFTSLLRVEKFLLFIELRRWQNKTDSRIYPNFLLKCLCEGLGQPQVVCSWLKTCWHVILHPFRWTLGYSRIDLALFRALRTYFVICWLHLVVKICYVTCMSWQHCFTPPFFTSLMTNLKLTLIKASVINLRYSLMCIVVC